MKQIKYNQMKYPFFLILLLLFIGNCVFSQQNNPPYRSVQNKYYWKNRKPNKAYWQQDVYYKINARINDNSNILDGSLELTYYNNSPDTLDKVYFHLYQNAFVPDSYFAQQSASNGNDLQYGKYQKMGLGTTIEEIYVGGVKHEWQSDNTIIKVILSKPINSGDSAVFKIKFKTYFNEDAGWGRMRLYKMWGLKHFNGANWYPRIAVYDAKFGWTADQHLVHEFYGDFGTYDVALDFPDNYIVEGTGTITNENEVLPKSLRDKIDLKNFKDKPFESQPSIIIPYDSNNRKTWKFHAINVHDFAFVASPEYRLGEVVRNGVRCIAVADESHASKWQTAPEITANIIDIYSKKIGLYAYPKIVVADASSGMEYPMLTMDSGTDPDYAYIFSHEVGHNWFYGMVGNNETYRAMLDEGFTQYLTVYALEKLQQKGIIESPSTSEYINHFQKKRPLVDRFAYLRYLRHAIKTEGATINTHSDMFDTKSPYSEEYRQVYYKCATMLFNLEYVLGEALFDKALKDYFEKWKFCHPYDEDFRASVMNSTKTDLNWFFDEFIETTKVIDYQVKSLKKAKEKDTYLIHFKRLGQMQMPIDFTVTDKKDSLLSFYIPNTDFVKKTSATILPKWYGWLNFNRDYTAKVVSHHGIKNVTIDRSQRLAVVYAPDNSLKRQVKYSFDYLINNIEDIHNYDFYYRPDLWWNGVDGLKPGINLNGNYMKQYHVFDFYGWFNSRLLQTVSDVKPQLFSFYLDYNTPVFRSSKKSKIFINALNSEGFNDYAVKLQYNFRPETDFVYGEVKSLFSTKNAENKYLIYPNDWEKNDKLKLNNTLSIGYTHLYTNNNREGSFDLKTTTSFLLSPYDFSKLSLTFINNEKVDILKFRTRLMMQWATGKQIPSESMLYLAGASPEEIIDNKFTRSVGFVPANWGDFGPNTNHFQAGGGLNVRGYAGYLVAQENKDGAIVPVYKGHSGASVNSELEFDGIFNIKAPKLADYFKLNTYFFADAGVISVNDIKDNLYLSDLRASAGAGIALTIKKWGNYTKLKPLTLRFDVPIFLNRPPAIDANYFNYRWIIGVNRAF